jgi:hypothetical protein
LRVLRMHVVDGLTGFEEQQVRTALLVCAGDIASEMQAKGIDDGCLDWNVPSAEEGRLLAANPEFEKAPEREQPRGDRSLLRRCP